MENADIAAVFFEIADLLHIQGGNAHRIRAFSRTARVVESLPQNARTMLEQGTLSRTPGLGDGSVRRIKDILRTGTCDEHRRLRRALPSGLRDMLDIKGLGARSVRVIYQHLRIGTIDELEVAARSGAIAGLPRMGQRTAEKILRGITEWRNQVGRVPWCDADRWVRRLAGALETDEAVQRLMIGGSVRRGKATVGDLDILVGADDKLAVVSHFLTLPEVDEVLVNGEGRCSVRLHNRQQCDLRVLDPETFGAGMHYFTGSKLHNIAIRARGLKLYDRKISDKGIFDRHTDFRLSPGATEEEIFAAVGLPFIAPELRENTGEIEAAEAGRLPRLVTADDLKGDLHMHTTASDGRGSVEEMAKAARALGHDYIAITDHTKALAVANGLDERRLTAQVRHIRDTEQELGELTLLAGTEVDILADGTLDIDLEVLRRLDWVVASVHSDFAMSGDEMTSRYIKAMESGVVDCIGHPTTRRLDKRKGVPLDMERLLKVARKLGVAMEVNGNPYRMDLPDVEVRMTREAGVPVALNTDAHAPGHLQYQQYGLLTARRGWLEPRDVLNCQGVSVLRERRRDRLKRQGVVVSTWIPAHEVGLEELAPAVPVESDHWGDPGAGGLDAPAPAEPDAPEPPSASVDLGGPVTPELRDRLNRFLQEGGDPALEAALEARGPNAMQAAFNLLFG
ncbi:MAG: DNA polymerase/3'-5' exonuclease PolX [Alphaproteobacteria bacterium]|nr:DNA polymerase/3'-5' exonuclease PolX [Alphaproteobacteria bacterium]MCB9694027.1 DNA polymerase/3'-5' exonuclease PolX [Alphaproteobacteria bacterium]